MHNDFKIVDYERKYHKEYIECIEGFYGNGYPYREYLDEEFIVKKIQSGDFILTLAVTDTDKVVATVASERMHGDFEGAVLLLLRNVLSDYRGSGVAALQLNDLLMKISNRFPDAVSVYADVMTHDAVSQNSLVHRGYTLCGLRLMIYDNKVMLPKLNFEPGTKMTQAIYCKNLTKSEVLISPPKKYLEIIEKTYKRLGVSCVFKQKTNTLEEDGRYSYKQSKRYQKGEFIINRAGKDLMAFIKSHIHKEENYTFIAYIDMNDTCSFAVEELKKLGFYFSGIMPLTNGGEYLLMAKTDACTENFEQIVLAEKMQDLLPQILELRNK